MKALDWKSHIAEIRDIIYSEQDKDEEKRPVAKSPWHDHIEALFKE